MRSHSVIKQCHSRNGGHGKLIFIKTIEQNVVPKKIDVYKCENCDSIIQKDR